MKTTGDHHAGCPRTWKTYALGTVAVAALLSSTACQETDEVTGAGKPSAGASGTSGTPSAAASATQDAGSTGDGGTDDGGSENTQAPSEDSGSGGTTACTDMDVSVTSKAEPRDNLQHLTLTATNIGEKTCTLYKYPLARFDEGSYDEVGPLESNAQAVATLEPGGKAYAGMRLFVAGEENRTGEVLTLGFQGRDSADEIGSPIDVPLPDGGTFLNIGPTPGVTFWDTDLKSVQKFTFAR